MKSLCDTCGWAHVMKGPAESQILVRCSGGYGGDFTVFQPITECNRFTNRNAMSLQSMKEMAYILKVKNGKPVGFNPPKKEEE
jgi:hypothetical protein